MVREWRDTCCYVDRFFFFVDSSSKLFVNYINNSSSNVYTIIINHNLQYSLHSLPKPSTDLLLDKPRLELSAKFPLAQFKPI